MFVYIVALVTAVLCVTLQSRPSVRATATGTRHAWLHTAASNMAPRTLYEILGLGITADVHDIKLAYRQLAKEYHPDKNTTPQATALFQDLNQAYHTLTNAAHRAEYDLSIGISEPRAHMNHDDNVSHMALPDLDFKIRENMMSVTIDVTDIMFLAFVEQCEYHYDIAPIDRGHHGLQFRFECVWVFYLFQSDNSSSS